MKERDENWQLLAKGVLKGGISGKIIAVGRQVSRADFARKFRAILEGLEGERGDDRADCMQNISARRVCFRFLHKESVSIPINWREVSAQKSFIIQ
jgi:hypothetical protein